MLIDGYGIVEFVKVDDAKLLRPDIIEYKCIAKFE